jgi:hypothetical protein
MSKGALARILPTSSTKRCVKLQMRLSAQFYQGCQMVYLHTKNFNLGIHTLQGLGMENFGIATVFFKNFVVTYLVSRYLVERQLVERHLVERHLVEFKKTTSRGMPARGTPARGTTTSSTTTPHGTTACGTPI